MKTAQQLYKEWQECPRTDLENFFREIQNDSRSEARRAVLGKLQEHWGHEIIRAVAKELCDRWGWDVPRMPFHMEHLHPGANRPAAPPPKVVEAWGNAPADQALRSQPSAQPTHQTPTLHPSPEQPPLPCAAPSQSSPPGQTVAAKQNWVEEQAAQSLKERPPLDVLDQLAALWQEVLKLRCLPENVESIKRLFATEHQLRQVEERVVARAVKLEESVDYLERQHAALVQSKHGERLEELERQMRLATEWLASLEQWKEELPTALPNLVHPLPPAPPGAAPMSDCAAPSGPLPPYLWADPEPGDYVDVRHYWNGQAWEATVSHRWQKAK